MWGFVGEFKTPSDRHPLGKIGLGGREGCRGRMPCGHRPRTECAGSKQVSLVRGVLGITVWASSVQAGVRQGQWGHFYLVVMVPWPQTLTQVASQTSRSPPPRPAAARGGHGRLFWPMR